MILCKQHACREAIAWVDDKTPYAAWRLCNRGDWLLWVAAKLAVDRKLVVLAACDCAERSMQYVMAGEDRPRMAIETARRWCDGRASLNEVRTAAYAASDASYAASDADDTSAFYASNASYASAYAASYAAYAAFYAASNADDAFAAFDNTLAECAKIVRRRIGWKVMRKALSERIQREQEE